MENISLTLKEKCLSPLNNPDKDLKILIKNIETIVEEKINNLNENKSNGGYLSQNQYDILNEDESNYSDDSITVISHESIDSDILKNIRYSSRLKKMNMLSKKMIVLSKII